MRTGFLAYFLSALVLTTACRRPVVSLPPPTWEESVTQAAEARATAAGLEPAARQECLDGFRYGAQMIQNAIQERRLPYRIKVGFRRRPPVPEGAMPPGVRIEVPPPVVEMDPETGFPWAAVMGGDGTWAQSAVGGFEWALARKSDTLRGMGFLRARPVPPMPPEDGWTFWPPSQKFITVETRNLNYALSRPEGVLLWTASGRGFAPVHTWCSAAGLPVDRVAAQDDVLWLNLSTGHALALDRDTGLVRALGPGIVAPPAAPIAAQAPAAKDPQPSTAARRPRKSQEDWVDRTWQEEYEESLKLAEAGDTYGMLCLARLLSHRKPAEGLAWLRKAADKGYPRAMLHLGMAYHEGQFRLQPDPIEARRWLERAAQAGDGEAKYGLKLLFKD